MVSPIVSPEVSIPLMTKGCLPFLPMVTPFIIRWRSIAIFTTELPKSISPQKAEKEAGGRQRIEIWSDVAYGGSSSPLGFGRETYFVSEGGYGGKDIYYINVEEIGSAVLY